MCCSQNWLTDPKNQTKAQVKTTFALGQARLEPLSIRSHGLYLYGEKRATWTGPNAHPTLALV